MMDSIASRSWVLDVGQNDGGEPLYKTQISNKNTKTFDTSNLIFQGLLHSLVYK